MKPHARTCLLLSAILLSAALAPAQPAPAAPDALGPAFEVATVKPTPKVNPGAGGWMGTRLLPSGHFSVHSMTLENLVNYAYVERPNPGKVQGGPSWVHSDLYDIEAKVDDAQMKDWDKLSDADRRARVMPLVRQLLAERFHLKVHTEMIDTQIYAIVQAKGGSKLKQVAKPEELEGEGDATQRMLRFMKDHPGQAAPGVIMCDQEGCRGHAVTADTAMGQIGANARTNGITINDTGLTGLYDFSYKVSFEEGALSPLQQIEDQLGLRFQPRKIPIKTYIIDSADKPQPD